MIPDERQAGVELLVEELRRSGRANGVVAELVGDEPGFITRETPLRGPTKAARARPERKKRGPEIVGDGPTDVHNVLNWWNPRVDTMNKNSGDGNSQADNVVYCETFTDAGWIAEFGPTK